MPYQNWEIFVSFAFYFGAKIISIIRMFRQDALTSIPERNEDEEPLKWVPKKKHEVLKAKYKCLKKLFQIYDATAIIGVLPEPNTECPDDTNTRRRLKRSHRTKTDACAGTTETIFNGEPQEEYDTESIALTKPRDLKINQSCSTQVQSSKYENLSIQSGASKSEITSNSDTSTEFSDDTKESCVNCHAMQQQHLPQNLPQHIVPYLMSGRRKLTRFQSFVQRVFGIRPDAFILPSDVYAASDSFQDRRRRRGLRFRRLRRAKKNKSDSDLNDMKGSAILSYVQCVQKSCLMDTTPRQCPVLGCKMVSYGIINYNDHLNLCHFKDRKHICHYCHEGFEMESNKLTHENEHIGLNKLSTNLNLSQKIASNCDTQTDHTHTEIQSEKLKKIVSFFDRIVVEDSEAKKRGSESNLTQDCDCVIESRNSSEKRTMSCMNIGKCKCKTSNSQSSVTSQQYGTPVSCHIGQNLKYRRRLSLHEDSKWRNSNKFSKFNSCHGLMNRPQMIYHCASNDKRNRDLVSEDGRLNVRSIDSPSMTETDYTAMTPSHSEVKLTRGKSNESLSCDPSTNIVYCTSIDSMKKVSAVESLVQKFRTYKWEPGTKVIRV